MQQTLLAACRWLETTPWAVAVRDSAVAYPIMQWVHFVGLSLWLGACLSVDLRLMNVGKRRQTAAELSDVLFVWKWIGFGIAVAGGFLLFSAYATMYVLNSAFSLKVAVLTPLAVMWHLVVQEKTGEWSRTEHTPAIGRWAGLAECVLWISVLTAAVSYLLTNVS